MSKSSYISKKIEKGQFLVIFGLLLIVFLGILAFAIDGGRIYIEQRRTQNAADNAAIAAGLKLCRGEETGLIVNEGRYIANENGYDNDGTSNIVTINLPPVYGSSAGRNNAVEAIVQSEIPGTFAQIIGVDSFTVTSRAVTKCTKGGAYAIFAGGDTCGEKQIDWSGSLSEVTGNVHSNNSIKVGGQGNLVEGEVTLSGADYYEEVGNTIPEPTIDGPHPYPILFNEDYYSSGPSGPNVYTFPSIESLNDFGGLLQPDGLGWVLDDGVYYTQGIIKVGLQNVTGNVTFVAGGFIDISGSNQNLTPYVDNLLLFSYGDPGVEQGDPNKRCTEPGVKIAGSQSQWQGVIYAPNAMISVSGSQESTISGSLIGYQITIAGSDTGIKVIEEPGPPRISLIE